MGNIGLYFELEGLQKGQTRWVRYEMTVKASDGRVIRCISEDDDEETLFSKFTKFVDRDGLRYYCWGFSTLIPHAEAPPAGSPLLFTVRFFVAKEDPAELLKLLSEIPVYLEALRAEMYTDFVLKVGGKDIKVHTVMLLRSKVIRQMMENNMQEISQGTIYRRAKYF